MQSNRTQNLITILSLIYRVNSASIRWSEQIKMTHSKKFAFLQTNEHIRSVGRRTTGSVSLELISNGSISSMISFFSKLPTSLSTRHKAMCCSCTESFVRSSIWAFGRTISRIVFSSIWSRTSINALKAAHFSINWLAFGLDAVHQKMFDFIIAQFHNFVDLVDFHWIWRLKLMKFPTTKKSNLYISTPAHISQDAAIVKCVCNFEVKWFHHLNFIIWILLKFILNKAKNMHIVHFKSHSVGDRCAFDWSGKKVERN